MQKLEDEKSFKLARFATYKFFTTSFTPMRLKVHLVCNNGVIPKLNNSGKGIDNEHMLRIFKLALPVYM